MNPQIEQLIGKAIEYFQGGSPKQAEEILLGILNTQSNNLPALEILGLIKASQGNHFESAKYLKKAVKLNPQNPATQYNLAKALSEGKDYLRALIHQEKALQLAPNNPDGWLNYGQTLAHLKRHEQALTAFNNVLTINPNNMEAWLNKGLACSQLERHTEAIDHYHKAIKIKSDNAKAWLDLSTSLGALKRYEDALHSCKQALQLQPKYPEALLNQGTAYNELKQYDQALQCYNQALDIKSDYVDAWYNKGISLEKLERQIEALECYDRAIELNPSLAKAWLNRGCVFGSLKRYKEALYSSEQALKLQPKYSEAWLNQGAAYNELKQYDQALNCYNQALEIKSDYVDAWYNKGVSLEKLDRQTEALECYDRAIEIDPKYAKAWLNQGEIFTLQGRYELALNNYEEALLLDPNTKFLQGTILHTNSLVANWENREIKVQALIDALNKNEEVAPLLPMLSISDSPKDHLKASQIWAKNQSLPNNSLGDIPKHSHQKIKIAYFSADFKDHPVSYLTAELFELHDRDRFEVYGFSFRKAQESPIRKRLISAFDHFIEVDNQSDQEVAQLVRQLEIDIAIDLGGYTQHARTGIFAHRAAPIQVNYLGFAGTMGVSYMDYIVADKIVIPPEFQEYYLEKKVYLPNSYMVDDSKRAPSNRQYSRSEFSLPEESIVFCCFNNSYKFNPVRVASFAKILSEVPNSVLWVTGNNPSFRKNLVAEFTKLGISEARIIFANIVDAMEDHLARYRLADLFLDTSPYNAHTTALDSLKSGVPIISLMGKSFASRVGASLLTAISLPELIVQSEQEFIELASRLGKDTVALRLLKEKLSNNLKTTPLFDAKLFCKHLESGYHAMHQKYLQDLPPSDIYIDQ